MTTPLSKQLNSNKTITENVVAKLPFKDSFISKLEKQLAPSPEKTRLIDFTRELPDEALRAGLQTLKGTARIGTTLAELPKLATKGETIRPYTIKGLEFLGPVESYGSEAVSKADERGGLGISALRSASQGVFDVVTTVALVDSFMKAFSGATAGGSIQEVKPQEIKPVPKNVMDEVNNHIKSAKLYEKDIPKEQLPAFIKRTQEHFQDITGVASDGHTVGIQRTDPAFLEAVNKLKTIDTSKMKSIDELDDAVKGLLGGSQPKMKFSKDLFDAVNRHVNMSKEVLKTMPPENLKATGGIPALIDSVKVNLIKGLEAEAFINPALKDSMNKATQAISTLDVKNFATLDSFQEALKGVLTGL